MRKFKVRQDRKLYVDWEMTCWENDPPSGEVPEIIEIGIAEVDVEKLVIVQSASYLVKNTLSTVSDYCTSLTGITQTMINKQGRPLSEVCHTLEKKFGTRNKAVCAWGSDEEAIERDCIAKNIQEPPFSRAFFNIGLEFSLAAGLNKSIGLEDALIMLGEEIEPGHHRAGPDALAAAKIDIVTMKHARQSMSFEQRFKSPIF